MTMEKKIKSELMKMSAIMAVLIGLGIYAHEFVLAGLQAKLALNLSIFVIAGVAAWITFRHVLSLKNETVALKALQVDYGSIRRRPTNPYRHAAIVFDEPELLGQGYRMITEECSKQGELKISNSTVQILLHDVDQRINDRKSTIMYFSGLMVFLGLLGAFMGLMKTVHSVSDLIGGMDLSGASGTEGMARMIEGMKAPLNGMSVGFSSSLFGLMTSMVLGALERCMTSAMKALRNEFEHWLTNLADLEGSASGTVDFGEVKQALDASSRQLETLRGTVSDTASHAIETRTAMAEMARAVQQLSQTVAEIHDPKPMLAPITDAVAELARNQMAMLANFSALYDRAGADRAHIAAILGGMTATVDRMNTLNGDQLHKQLDNLAVLMAQSARATAPPAMPATPAAQPQGPGLIARLLGRAENLTLRGELRRMMLGHRRLVRKVGMRLDDRLARLEAGQDEDRELLGTLLARASDQQARLEALIDDPAAGDAGAATGPLSGARREMDVLRRRLNAEIREDGQPPASTDKDATQAGKPASGRG
jgi:hypothetical protein